MKLEPYTEELRGCPVKGNAYPVLVLGIGNPLMGDDGAGVELAHRLQERDYGPLVHVEEGGTQGMTLLPLLEDADTLILLDAVRTGALPGTVVTRSREELPRHFSRVMSPHQIGMKEVLGAAQLCGTLPRAITLVGVEALHTDFCRPMSAEVQEALPKALDTAEALIARALAEHQARKNAHAGHGPAAYGKTRRKQAEARAHDHRQPERRGAGSPSIRLPGPERLVCGAGCGPGHRLGGGRVPL